MEEKEPRANASVRAMHCARFGTIVKAMRNTHGMTQAKVAAAAGVSQQTISGYETGNAEPTMSSLEALADLFKVSIDQLIGRKR